jgi:uncharacterized alkaline shock family protein YloU
MFVSVFNRVVVVIIALLILAGAVITLLVATGASTPDVLPYGWFESQLRGVAEATGGTKAAIIALSIVIAVAMIGILSLEVTPSGKPASLLISSTEEGVITVSVESVCALAEKTAATIHNVHSVKCGIREKVGTLFVSCRPSVILGTNLPEIGAELQSRIKEAIEELTGLSVAQVNVKIKYESSKAKRMAVR